MFVSSRARRKALLFSTLLLVALVVLTGCPDEGGGNGNQPGNGDNGGGGGNGGPPPTKPTDNDPIDGDGDLLIDISSLERLNNVRHNLAGTAYRDSATASGVQCGAAADTACRGYELLRSLDFAAADSYIGAVNDAWRPEGGDPATATNGGWVPIGGSFTATFEGNGNTISNLYIRRSGNIGLFSSIDLAVISNIGVINGMVYGSAGGDRIGMFVGIASQSTIVASYASGGTVSGVDGSDNVGGLVGRISGSDIVASYATVAVDGGAGIERIGGLVGEYTSSDISASYATGNVDGGADRSDNVGGLVGYQTGNNSDIIASYATGNVDGGEGMLDNVGRLIGLQDFGRNIVSYGFGTKMGGERDGVNSTHPSGVTSANQLTLATAGDAWNDAASPALNAWDFGDATQAPALQYADYDGDSGSVYACATASNPPADAILIAGAGCASGELIPGQR